MFGSTPWKLGGLETCVVPVVRVYFYSLDALVLNSGGAMVSPAASVNELVTHRNSLFIPILILLSEC